VAFFPSRERNATGAFLVFSWPNGRGTVTGTGPEREASFPNDRAYAAGKCVRIILCTVIPNTGNVDAARAVGRCYGALFFTFFGAAWLVLAAYAFGTLNGLDTIAIAGAMTLLVNGAVRLLRRGKDAAKNAFPEAEQRRNDRIFGIVNAVTWVSVILVFQILPRLGLGKLIFPAVVLLVGLHFFLMPRLYRHGANLVTGAAMAVWAILCALVFHGDRMIGFVAAGAGVALWVSAVWALKTAAQLLRSGRQAR
jgi:hypothetical protein